MVSFPELRKGEIGLVVATQIARYVEPGNKLPGWKSPEQAWSQTQAQLACYKVIEECGELTTIREATSQLEQFFCPNAWVINRFLPIKFCKFPL